LKFFHPISPSLTDLTPKKAGGGIIPAQG